MANELNSTIAAGPVSRRRGMKLGPALAMLWRDKFALVAALILLVIVLCAIFGPWVVGDAAIRMNLRARNAQPFSFNQGFLFFLGADSLGRSIIARIILASRTTLAIAGAAVLCSLAVGTTLGLVAGYKEGPVSTVILRLTDVLMSFPSLLLALVVLYVFAPSPINVVWVLAITRIPIYLRTCRAEVMEIRERMFVTAARVTGASVWRLVWRHILPMAAPTLVTIATLDFAFVMLSESSLSFLGLGVQPPDITWGLMVSEGRNYLGSAWWLSFWPGLAIAITTMSLNLFANWVRIVLDPVQRWRLDAKGGSND
jgi:peptide/nickel transport system permease protein